MCVCLCVCVHVHACMRARVLEPGGIRMLVGTCMRNSGGLITSQRAEIFPAFCLFLSKCNFSDAIMLLTERRRDGLMRSEDFDKLTQFPTKACDDLADASFDSRP